jgi:hypothetical protein
MKRAAGRSRGRISIALPLADGLLEHYDPARCSIEDASHLAGQLWKLYTKMPYDRLHPLIIFERMALGAELDVLREYLETRAPERTWRPLFARVWNRHAAMGLYLHRETLSARNRRKGITEGERVQRGKSNTTMLRNMMAKRLAEGWEYPLAVESIAASEYECSESTVRKATADLNPNRRKG